MDSITLPKINRSVVDSGIIYTNNGRVSSPDHEKTEFELKMEKLTAMYFPEVDAAASVKARLSTLEETCSSQAHHNRQTEQTLECLSKDLERTDGNIKDIILNMQNDFDARLQSLKKEYDHRFDLQASENKRLQTHVATLKADTNQLKRKMQSTIEKLRKLQHEFGDPDEIDEESSIQFSPASTSSQILSRPNTTNY